MHDHYNKAIDSQGIVKKIELTNVKILLDYLRQANPVAGPPEIE